MQDHDLATLFDRFRRQGDLAALGQVFDATAPELLGIARHLLGESALAEDALQATFLTALERGDEFDGERRLVPWLIGILVNHARTLGRRGARERSEVTPELHPRGDDPAAAVQGRELERTVHEALGRLPETYRELLRSHLFRGCRPSELAEDLGISANAARVRLFRGLELLRKALPVGLSGGAVTLCSPTARAESLGRVRSTVLARGSELAAFVPVATGVAGGTVALWLAPVAVLALLTTLGPRLFSAGTEGSPAPVTGVTLTDTTNKPLPAPPEATAARTTVAQEPGAASFRLSGRVTHHFSSQPIGGATVFTLDAEGRPLERARTEDDGRFAFLGTPEDEETLAVLAAGFAPLRAPLDAEPLAAFRREFCRDETTRGVNYADLRLTPGMRVEGRVVDDATGRAIEGARVWTLQEQAHGFLTTGTAGLLGQSAADGHVAVKDRLALPHPSSDFNYLLLAFNDEGLGWTRLPAVTGREEVTPFEIRLHPGVDFDLRVEDPLGVPIAGARVQLLPSVEPFRRSPGAERFDAPAGLEERFAPTTDADGLARFRQFFHQDVGTTRLVHGRLRVECDGYRLLDENLGIPLPLAGTRRLILHPLDTEELAGLVLDLVGRPLEGARVSARGQTRAALSDAAGRFRLGLDTRSPRTQLVVEAEGFAPLAHAWSAGSDLPPFQLAPAVGLGGWALDQHGWALADWLVLLAQVDERGESVLQGRVGADGRFEFPSASAGNWHVSLRPGSGRPPVGEVHDLEGLPAFLEAGRTDHRLRVTREPATGLLELALAAETTGEPLAALEVRVFQRSTGASGREEVLPVRTCRIERDGNRVRISTLRPGAYSVWATVPGFALLHGDFEVGDGEVHGRLLGRHAGGLHGSVAMGARATAETKVRARLVDGAHTPLGAEWIQGSALEATLVVEPDGRFQASGLTPGTWALALEGPGLFSAETRVEVLPEEVSEVRLEPRAPAQVRLLFDAPLEGSCRLRFARPGDSPPSHLLPGEDVRGQRELDWTLGPGPWRWSFQTTGASGASCGGELTLLPGERVTVRVALPEAGAVR